MIILERKTDVWNVKKNNSRYIYQIEVVNNKFVKFAIDQNIYYREIDWKGKTDKHIEEQKMIV